MIFFAFLRTSLHFPPFIHCVSVLTPDTRAHRDDKVSAGIRVFEDIRLIDNLIGEVRCECFSRLCCVLKAPIVMALT